ncbi:hypothetical protein S2M10_31600 [Sphingomonas sp. S2M10]|mgnify:CR=1 FL=1|uniref:hypothetical protein n=1 Tax=Sphingomonas sp. S2M10 TaxID=2705010 RepID=UPI001456E61E|nr:hypothetical protein [Sphingomonas sp. S2M10]NLS28151.1 hypothetical protein [Sphingomonas sp. S2M10]
MPVGLWVGLEDGTTLFNQTTAVVKFLGAATIGAAPGGPSFTGDAQSGSIVDARFTQFAMHVPFWCRIDGGFDDAGYDATWSVSGSSLIWTFPRPAEYSNGLLYNRPVQTIIYGIR